MTNYEPSIEAGWERLKEPLLRADGALLPPAGVLSLARAVAGAPDPDMTCEEAEALLPLYVEDEVAGLPVEQCYASLARHLELCDECALAYAEMRHWARLEDEGQLPQVPFAMPDLSFLAPISRVDYVLKVAKGLVKRLMPDKLDELTGLADIFREVITVAERGFIFPAGAHLGHWDAFELLRVTYNTTEQLRQAHREELEREVRRGTFSQSLHREVLQTARQHFSEEEAEAFAEAYTEIVEDSPTLLQSLLREPIAPP